MKRRFKKALFAFFKDEIMNEVSTGVSFKAEKQFENAEIKFIELSTEITISERDNRYAPSPRLAMENAIQRAKEELFNKSMQFVSIKASDIFSEEDFGFGRRIKVSFFIGQHKNEISTSERPHPEMDTPKHLY